MSKILEGTRKKQRGLGRDWGAAGKTVQNIQRLGKHKTLRLGRKELTMGSQLLLSILKDSGIADIAVSIVDYFIGKKDFDKKKKSAASRQAKKGGLR